MRVGGRSVVASLACAVLLGAAGCGPGGGGAEASHDRDVRHKGIQPPPNAISPNVRMTDTGRDLPRDRAVDALTDPAGTSDPAEEQQDPLAGVSGDLTLDGSAPPASTTSRSPGGTDGR